MTLYFNNFETAILFTTVLVVNVQIPPCPSQAGTATFLDIPVSCVCAICFPARFLEEDIPVTLASLSRAQFPVSFSYIAQSQKSSMQAYLKFLIQDGRSNYLEGILLMSVYIIICIAVYLSLLDI